MKENDALVCLGYRLQFPSMQSIDRQDTITNSYFKDNSLLEEARLVITLLVVLHPISNPFLSITWKLS